MIQHRPPHEMLVDFATGALPQPVALAVATHAELCTESRQEIADMEAVGGAMLSKLKPVAMSEGALDAVLAAIDNDDDVEGADRLPKDVRAVLDGRDDGLVWKKKWWSVEAAALPSDAPGYEVRLLRIKAGRAVPQHTHDGVEITLCLTGGYRDGDNHYARGDFQVADPTLSHRPLADADGDCIVLAVVEKRIRLTSPAGRLVNPFVRL